MRTGKVACIADRVRKELGELTPQERDLAVKALRDALYEGFALDAATSDPKQMDACVRCGSIRIIRKGHGRDASLSRRVNANSQQRFKKGARRLKLIKNGEC